MVLIQCEECGGNVSDKAFACPKCGHPVGGRGYPPFVGWWFGYEWKSEAEIFGLPLVHVAIGWNTKTGRLHVAKGIIAIGQFGIGLVTIAQFGIGLLFAAGQFVGGTYAIGQFALGLVFGLGQFATGARAIGQFTYSRNILSQLNHLKGLTIQVLSIGRRLLV
jgi:hypothetical protein